MAIKDALLPEFDQEMATTRRILERVPEGKTDWRPHPKSMPFGRLATHVAEIPSWIVNTLTQTELDLSPPPGQTYSPNIIEKSAERLAYFDKNRDEARAALLQSADPVFMVPWSLKRGPVVLMTLPRAAVYRGFCMNHLIHHRAQLGVYLRLLEVALPSSYGPTADERM